MTIRVAKSMKLYDRAKELIAGRTHLFSRRPEILALGVSPVYSLRQKAGHFWDIDGNVLAFQRRGPRNALQKQAQKAKRENNRQRNPHCFQLLHER